MLCSKALDGGQNCGVPHAHLLTSFPSADKRHVVGLLVENALLYKRLMGMVEVRWVLLPSCWFVSKTPQTEISMSSHYVWTLRFEKSALRLSLSAPTTVHPVFAIDDWAHVQSGRFGHIVMGAFLSIGFRAFSCMVSTCRCLCWAKPATSLQYV